MSGVTLKDLSSYHDGAMKWFKDGLVSEQNRLFAQTEEAGAVSFWPLGGTPLEGKVKFSFKETPPASGDKGPENPSTIAGVSNVVFAHCGKNLYTYSGNKTVNGITFTDNGDGSITVNGTAISAATYRLSINPNASFWIKSGVPYYISGCPSGGSGTTYYIAQYNGVGRDTGSGFAILMNESKASAADIVIYSGYTASNLTFWPQLELGTSATSFENGSTTNYTIPLGNTYYGGEIDLVTGVMTVTWGCVVLDGTETWYKHSDSTSEISHFFTSAGMSSDVMSNVTANRSCSHFPFNYNAVANTFYTWGTATRIGIKLPATSYPDVSSLTSWLASEYSAGHPVTVTYELAVPFTVQLTPLQLTALTQKDKYTPRMNTVYTDADSIQIRYRKSLIHDEDEKVQAIVALGGNV